jgi:hypothetical protein
MIFTYGEEKKFKISAPIKNKKTCPSKYSIFKEQFAIKIYYSKNF